MRSPSCPIRLLGPLLAVAVLVPSLARAAENAPIPAAPAPAAAENAVAARLDALRARILARLGTPAVAADLYELEDVLQQGGSLERGADTLQRVAASGRTGPEVRALAHRMLADVERLRGRLPRMDDHLAAIGAIRELAIVGPFDDENEGGFDVAYGPEAEVDLAKTYAGLRGEVAWRVVEGLGRTGTIALHEAVRPTHEVLIYGLVALDAPAATNARLYLGTPGATKAWLNGKAILADPADHAARFDQSAVPLPLQKGRNVLLLKLAAGSRGPFELHARVVGEDGRPVRGLRVTAPHEGRFRKPDAIPAGVALRAARPVVDPLAKLAASGEPEALYAYARVLAERQPFDEADKLDEAAAAKAARAAPHDVDAQLLAARTADDANEVRAFLEKAAAAEPVGEARAVAALAKFWLGRGESFRALRLLQGPAEKAPGDWPAQLVLAQAYDAQGADARAARLVEALADRFPGEPKILEALARHRLRENRADEATKLQRVVLSLRPASIDAAASLASVLVDRGQVDDADAVLANAMRLGPPDVSLLLRRADLLAANGKAREAAALYDEAQRLCPQEGEVFERAGQSALRDGRRDEAIAFFQRSLGASPQNARLKELVQSLTPGEASFAAPFLRDLREAANAAKPHEGEDAVKLVDLSVTRVLPSGQASRTVQQIVRVQNPRGVDRWRATSIRYAPDRDAVKVERARVLKADGTIVDAHTEGDRSMNEPWAGLYYDTRARVIGFPSLQPGDVVELVYRTDDVARDNLLGDYFGDVSYIEDTVPTEHWEYVLEMPAGRPIFANQPKGTAHEESDGGRLHRWVAHDVAKIQPEADMPGWSEVASYLHVSTYRDWESVARFWWGLVKDQVAPTPEIERVAREIVDGIPASDTAARVRAVYGYVVKNTRYVGLEFGIHSFKPYKVEQVLRRRFGDCKDKASLTYALLRAVGIDSRLVLLRMRHLGHVGETPASLAVFNHAIVYVPQLDLWLDGTAEWSGSNELPEADRGAEVLVVDPSGTSVFRTIPEAPASLSVNESRHAVRLAADGGAVLDGESTIRGLPAPGYRRAYASANGRKASFEQAWARSFPGVSVTRLEMSDLGRLEDEVHMGFGLQVPGYAERLAGGRLSFHPFGDARSWTESLAPVSVRRHPLVLRHAFENRFRTRYELPAGYGVEQMPKTGKVESKFGAAELAFARDGDAWVATGRIAIAVPRVEAADYAEFRTFLGRVDELFGGKVVIAPGAEARR